jgi:hypothetical protein
VEDLEKLRSDHFGRVGVCTQGAASGQHVLIVSERRKPGWWVLYCEPPWKNFRFHTSAFGFDNYIDNDAGMLGIISAWGVEFMSRGDDVEIEQRIFAVRESFIPD